MKNLSSKVLLIICLLLASLLFRECESNKACDCNFEEPTGTLTPAEANQKEERYKSKEQVKNEVLLHVLNNDLENPDVILQLEALKQNLATSNIPVGSEKREVWFDLENLENYINYVKTESAEQNLENLGLRVYFAAKEEGSVNTTAFFVPTHQEGGEEEEEEDPILVELNINTPGMLALNYGSSGDPDDIEFDGGD